MSFNSIINMELGGLLETLYMVLASTAIGYAVGLPLGVILNITDKNGIKPNPTVFSILDFIVNIGRSIPFLILMIMLMPITRAIVGKSYGTTATIVPLTISAIPFFGRMVDSSLKEVDHGVIEAAQSMGASALQIIIKVLIPESRTSLINGATIGLVNVVGYSAMAGAIGGGGLGDIAIRYGYYRWETAMMMITVVVIVVLIQIMQYFGSRIATSLDRRIR